MKILIDAMGGDNSPDEIIKGSVNAIDELESEIVLIGKEELINQKVKEIYGKDNIKEVSPRISIKNAEEVIENCESPTEAIKKKKDSIKSCTKIQIKVYLKELWNLIISYVWV